jgi:hypothetical protein
VSKIVTLNTTRKCGLPNSFNSPLYEVHLNNTSTSVATFHKSHSVSATKTSRLILFAETLPVYIEVHKKHINTACG